MRAFSAVLFFIIGLQPRPVFAAISAVWANSGDDKVTQDELRATRHSADTTSRAWDGKAITIFGARNEVVPFNLVIEAASGAPGVSVSFNTLKGPSGATIKSVGTTGNGVFIWTERNIELFYVRYLQIRGLSRIANQTYDERIIPRRLRRPFTVSPFSGKATGDGLWTDRPDHDKFYPEIAVPLELNPVFDIAPETNQSIWVDIYIPKTAPSGDYVGSLTVRSKGAAPHVVPVHLIVRRFVLPEDPSSKTMLYVDSADIDKRFLGNAYLGIGSALAGMAGRIMDRYFMLAHRHRISLIGDGPGTDCVDPGDQPCPEWNPRLDGSLFTSKNGYSGPGEGVGNGVYSIGTYGQWNWKKGAEQDMWLHADRWASWFGTRFPTAEYFLYLADESSDYPLVEKWAKWVIQNPGPGNQMRSFATVSLPLAVKNIPDLDIPASTMDHGIPSEWEPVAKTYTADSRRRFFMYNGHRPASGSFATEDDGVALRELAWGQYKKHINRWFYWQGTCYSNFQGGRGDTDLFAEAQTYGAKPSTQAPNILGQTAWNYGNGDGVLFYPGTDMVFPNESYGVDGPFASLRLKYWRRGIQDADYLQLAAKKDAPAVDKIVNRMAPKVLWDYGVHDSSDPTYQYTDISWPTDADSWENARAELADIIEGSAKLTKQ